MLRVLALDDPFGTGVTVRSCCEERFQKKKTLQKTLNSPTVAKVFENKFSQVVKTSFDFALCLFGFVETTKFIRFEPYSTKFSIALKMFWERDASLVNIIYQRRIQGRGDGGCNPPFGQNFLVIFFYSS